jgi:hypothetical protein
MLLSCLGLSGWVIYLSLSIPASYSTSSWRVAWVGFDIGMLMDLVAATLSVWRKKASAVIYLGVLGAALIIDAWFDIATSSGVDLQQAILLAILLEGPIAIFLFWVSHKMLRRIAHGIALGEIELDPFDDEPTKV